MVTIEMVTIEKEMGNPIQLERNVYPVLLAGGTGTRLWPVSRERYPKQLVKFIGRDSLVQSTIKRMVPVLDIENVRIVCGAEHFYETLRHMEEIGVSAEGKIISGGSFQFSTAASTSTSSFDGSLDEVEARLIGYSIKKNSVSIETIRSIKKRLKLILNNLR